MDLKAETGMVVETKKQHPCGGSLWEIVRTGADVKLKCKTCGRCILLGYDELNKRVRRVAGEGK